MLSSIRRIVVLIFIDNHGEVTLPENVIKAIAEVLFENIVLCLQTDEGKKEFEQWKKEHDNK